MKKFLFVALLAIPGCAFESKPSTPVRVPPPRPLLKVSAPADPYAIHEQTPSQKAAADSASNAYFDALLKTILRLDDGVSNADVVARAAVAENIDLLREKVRTAIVHISESSWLGKEQGDKVMARLPEERDIALASAMVFEVRKRKR